MNDMDFKKILDNISTDFPIALTGCRAENIHHVCCDYNIIVFDQTHDNDSVIEIDNEFVRLHHGDLNETRIEFLNKYQNLEILSDPKWELKIFLSKIKEKKDSILRACYKKYIIESQICITKAKDGLNTSDSYTSCWLKSAAYFLVDSILLLNNKNPFPVHILDTIRNLKNNKNNNSLSLVTEYIGLERSTTSLLTRMLKSTQGFSDMIEKNNHSKIIQKKSEFLISNSLFTDCYLYLGYINRNNFYKIRNSIQKTPEFYHILKTAFDLENDTTKIESQLKVLSDISNDLLKNSNF
tara:strand:- start:89 stop:976 length:888 start_codon:yes stop_codon:yes gene_type:complete